MDFRSMRAAMLISPNLNAPRKQTSKRIIQENRQFRFIFVSIQDRSLFLDFVSLPGQYRSQ